MIKYNKKSIAIKKHRWQSKQYQKKIIYALALIKRIQSKYITIVVT